MEEARRALADIGLSAGTVSRSPDRLSGGEPQRAALTRALLARPRVLVCDEITSGLDMVTRRSVMEVLTGLLAEPEHLFTASLVAASSGEPDRAGLPRALKAGPVPCPWAGTGPSVRVQRVADCRNTWQLRPPTPGPFRHPLNEVRGSGH